MTTDLTDLVVARGRQRLPVGHGHDGPDQHPPLAGRQLWMLLIRDLIRVDLEDKGQEIRTAAWGAG